MKTLLLIDGDSFVHRASCAVTVTNEINDCKRETYVEPQEMLDYIVSFISKLSFDLRSDRIKLYFSCSRAYSFRRKLYPLYKANRESVARHLGIRTVKELLKSKYECFASNNLEADDLIGIEATTKDEWDKIIVGNDKDFLTIPAKYLCFLKQYDGIVETSVEQANRNHLLQTLTGDPSDGYKGCPNIGLKKAEKIVDGGWDTVVEAYLSAGLSEKEALLNARLAFILRKENINSKGEVILWKPKQD